MIDGPRAGKPKMPLTYTCQSVFALFSLKALSISTPERKSPAVSTDVRAAVVGATGRLPLTG